MVEAMNTVKKYAILIAFLLRTTVSAIEYGVDVSFPIHHANVSTNYAWLPHNVDPNNNTTPEEYKNMPIQYLPGRQQFYDEFMRGCIEYHGKKGSACLQTEKDRIAMSLRQPKSMKNFTDSGFKKLRAPDELFQLLNSFWEQNKDNQITEKWFTGNTYTNNWASPTKMINVEDRGLRGGGFELKQKVWNAAKSTIEEWTGNKVKETSLYGIRVYNEGAVLAPHVDRMPLVSSAITNVAQDVDEDWPLEVYGHDGKAHNITMEPGDMVLYESHSLLHGRPFALKGRYYANIFIHFEPIDPTKIGHDEDNKEKMPMYILEGSQEETKWSAEHPNERLSSRSKPIELSTSSTAAHVAAQNGDVQKLQQIAKTNKTALMENDANGWQPLHEAARAGHENIVKFLIEYGVGVNERTNFDKGASALWLAEKEHGLDHPVTLYLRKMGGISIPEL